MFFPSLYHQGLDRETLGILVALCYEGVNPEALAEVVKYLRRESRNKAESAM